MKVEYRVRPVTRYIVTRYHESDGVIQSAASGGCETKGEFASPDVAYQVAYALAKEEHQRLGYPTGDERIQYPRPVVDQTPAPVVQKSASCAVQVTDEMVNRFLMWKLPYDFLPDGGVSFSRTVWTDEGTQDRANMGPAWWPIGTNLLSAEQAKAMLTHVMGVGLAVDHHPV